MFQILEIDLSTREYFFKNIPELTEYIGGLAASLYLLDLHVKEGNDLNQNYFSILSGPLNGLFPYTSKCLLTSVKNGQKETTYAGGSFAAFMNFSNLLAIEIKGSASVELSIEITQGRVKFIESVNEDVFSALLSRKSVISFDENISSDGYFDFGKNYLNNNLKKLSIVFEDEFQKLDSVSYNDTVADIMALEKELTVSRGSHPSCLGCPMGCAQSKNVDTVNSSLLSRCLIACGYAASIYSDINVVFSCFQILGLKYNHDFLEKFPYKVRDLINQTNKYF